MDAGLENVIAAETVLSHVEGTLGRLRVRGVDIDVLASQGEFENVIELLWGAVFSELSVATTDRQVHFHKVLADARSCAFDIIMPISSHIDSHDPVEALRIVLGLLCDENTLETAAQILGVMSVMLAYNLNGDFEALRRPCRDLTMSQDVFHMARYDDARRDAAARGLDAYLATVCDHGLNASTFTARIVASTRAGLVSSTIAGLSALKGPLHGGAPGPVLDMLDQIEQSRDPKHWVSEALGRGERIMGFGHRVYRTRDPRADALKSALSKLPWTSDRMRLAEQTETIILGTLKAHKPDRALNTNVEYYTALLLDALGFSREAFTVVFAAGRSAGWIAHAREQAATGRLIRPKSRYVGPK